ncbi:MAG: Peptidyl-dipeptidase Dcp, partial [Verrucomicrobiales bacterium]|nr:Peptidyl-dipeptidase Dcp [Verrucomicrobiales bacterium]
MGSSFRIRVRPMHGCFRHTIFAICLLALHSAAQPVIKPPMTSKTTAATNPLLSESTLQFQFPPFDKITDDHFKPAMEQGIADELKEAMAIANQPETPTFENTIVALEKMGQLLSRVRRIFSNLNSANTNPQLQALDKEMAPRFSAHSDAIHLNGPLFKRIEMLYHDREKSNLDPESKWLLERYYKDFVRDGARLSDSDKQKLKALNAELATLKTTFAQNVLKERNASSVVVDSREELAGLSDSEITAAAATAKSEGKDGKFVL